MICSAHLHSGGIPAGRRTAGIGSIITIGAGMMAIVAIIGMVISFSNVIESTYMQLAFETPGFQYSMVDGVEHGNEMLEIYKIMRVVGAGLFVLVLIFAGLGRLLESAELGIIPPGMANRMISKSLLFLLVIFVFPPIWDMAADGMTNISYWILNPAYSFDQEHHIHGMDGQKTVMLQCPHAWGVDSAGEFHMETYMNEVELRYLDSIYIPNHQKSMLESGGDTEAGPADRTAPGVIFSESRLYGPNTLQVKFTEPVIASARHFEGLTTSTDRAISEIAAYHDMVVARFAGPPVTGNASAEFGIAGGMEGLRTSGNYMDMPGMIQNAAGTVHVLAARITYWDDTPNPEQNRHQIKLVMDIPNDVPTPAVADLRIGSDAQYRNIKSLSEHSSGSIRTTTITFDGPASDPDIAATISVGTEDMIIPISAFLPDTAPIQELNLVSAHMYGHDAILLRLDGPVGPGVMPSDISGGILTVVEERTITSLSGNGTDTLLVGFDGPPVAMEDPGTRVHIAVSGLSDKNGNMISDVSDYITGPAAGPAGAAGMHPHSAQNMEFVCSPQLKLNYIFQQMLRDTSDTENTAPIGLDEEIRQGLVGTSMPQAADWTSNIFEDIQKGLSDFMINMFMGLTKALVALQILILSLMIGIMADMLVAMIAAGLPVFLMLSLIPKTEDVANKMLQALPALLLLPLMSAIIVVVGASAVVEAGGTGNHAQDHIYTWITSIGVVFFAVTIPVILVPLLGNVSQMATQMVGSAVSTGAIVTGMAASGASTAMRDFAHYSRVPGTSSGLEDPQSEYQEHGGHLGLLKSGLGGFMRGLGGAHGMVGMPAMSGMGGTGMIDLRGMESAIQGGAAVGHAQVPGAAGFASTKQQDGIVHQTIDRFSRLGYSKENTDALSKVLDRHGTAGMADLKWNRRESLAQTEVRLDQSIACLRQYYDSVGGMPDDVDEAVHNIEGPIKEAVRNARAGTFDAHQRTAIIDQLDDFDQNFKRMVSPGNKIANVDERIRDKAWRQ